MHQVVIAEDEEQMRLIIEELIPWDKDFYSVCCSCSNGLEAKECIDNYPVDVAILDINMPHMNGLELAKYIYENYPYIQVVLISAYKEFEYAKQALEYDVLDYVTKPITRASIDKAFEKIRQRLLLRKGSQFLNEDRLIKRQQLFFNLMSSGFHGSRDDVLRQLRYFNVDIDNDNYPCSIINIEIEDYDNFIKTIWHRERERFYETLSNVVTAEELFSYVSVLSTDNNHIEMAIISKSSNNADFEIQMQSDLDELKKNIENIFSIKVNIIAGKVFLSIFDYIKNQRTDDCVKNQLMFTINHLSNEEKELMIKCIECADKVINGIDNLVMFYKQIVLKFVEILEYSQKPFVKSEYISAYSTGNPEEMKRNVIILAEKTYSTLFADDENAVMRRAIKYINENYSDDLSLQSVAQLASLSSCYFSSMFKKYVGIGFSTYLNQIRIDKAKEFLANTEMKIQSIAFEVGFKEVTYFYKSFKGVMGCTPAEYREQMREEANG